MAQASRATVTINTGNGWSVFKRNINKNLLRLYFDIRILRFVAARRQNT